MKTKIICGIILLLSISGCKKDSNSDSAISGNFISINGDKRIIDATNSNVTINCGTYGYPCWQFHLLDKQFSTGIAGLPNNEIEFFINIYDLDLLKDQYALVTYTGNGAKGFAEILVRVKKNGASFTSFNSTSSSGIVNYSLSGNKKVVEFDNIKLFQNSVIYTISGRIECFVNR